MYRAKRQAVLGGMSCGDVLSEQGYTHCGECADIPCGILKGFSCGDGEHCDKPAGARIAVCRAWAANKLLLLTICTKLSIIIIVQHTNGKCISPGLLPEGVKRKTLEKKLWKGENAICKK
jgi:hypothetical protein